MSEIIGKSKKMKEIFNSFGSFGPFQNLIYLI